MNPFLFLMLLTVVGVSALFIALAFFLWPLVHELELIGGPTTRFRRPANYLGKIRLGLRAIEMETSAIVPQVTRLNTGLRAVRDGLRAIDDNLNGTIEAVTKQNV